MKNMTKAELLQLLNKYKKLSFHDSLTLVYNRRKLKQDLKEYVTNIKRYSFKYSIALIDIDKFKYINDSKGHKFGDKVLRLTARTIKKNVRVNDRVYRVGGDEFVIVFKYTKKENADKVILDRISNLLLERNISISFGLVELNQNTENTLELVDYYMYRNKNEKKQ